MAKKKKKSKSVLESIITVQGSSWAWNNPYAIPSNFTFRKPTPAWSIYNNELKWFALSDKQKGEMLLAAHSGVKFKWGLVTNDKPVFDDSLSVYTAVKPEPTMEELFSADWALCYRSADGKLSEQMIAKGWVKK
jgi:hypothetical protein